MINWQTINTVFLDMDGTLLDLHFDNFFWLSHLPRRYASHHDLPETVARQQLLSLINEQSGKLNWYCIDYWTDTLDIDIRSLKTEVQHLIAYRPHVEHFLARLKTTSHRVLLVTNAHPDTLALKQEITGLGGYLDQVICSHHYGYPKEDQGFWRCFHRQHPFEPANTLLIDDSLPVLRAARQFGIQHLLTIAQPDSRQPHRQIDEFPSLVDFRDILPDPETGGHNSP